MKNKLIKILSILAIVIVLASVFIVPVSAASDVLSPNQFRAWNTTPAYPDGVGSADYSETYYFDFLDARGYFCKGMSLNYRSSEGFYIDYIYDTTTISGSQMVYNDGSGREEMFWTPYAKYITILTLPDDTDFVNYLLANTTLSNGGSYSEGYNAGLNEGYDRGYASGYQDGLGDADRLTYEEGYHDGYYQGQDDISSGEWGANLIGDTFSAPFKGLNQFILFEYENVYGISVTITLGHIVGGVIAFCLFIAFLKLFAGG